MKDAVHVVAVGARTPVGLRAATSAAAVRAGLARIVLHPFMADETNENLRGAIDGRIDPGILGWRRCVFLGETALIEAIDALRAAGVDVALPVLLCMPEARPGFQTEEEQSVLAELSRMLLSTGRGLRPILAGRGHAGVLSALRQGVADIESGHKEIGLICGIDSYFDFETIEWLQSHRQLATKETRSGFIPGEGAGVIAIASDRARAKWRLPSLAIVRGLGESRESRMVKGDLPSTGKGLSAAIAAATSGLRLPEEAADVVYCDINGERYRSEEWSLAVLRTPQAASNLDFVAPVDCWGDVGAASGALFSVLAIQSWQRGYAPGRRALIWTGSESGLRTAAVLEAPR